LIDKKAVEKNSTEKEKLSGSPCVKKIRGDAGKDHPSRKKPPRSQKRRKLTTLSTPGKEGAGKTIGEKGPTP